LLIMIGTRWSFSSDFMSRLRWFAFSQNMARKR
jgi:hypothetical protein